MYITFAELKDGSAYDPAEWDELTARRPATVTRWLKMAQAQIDDPLRLRYAVPFGATPPSLTPDPAIVPELVKGWQIELMDARFLRARRMPGTESSDDADISGDARAVLDAIASAADQDKPAHPELPLRSTVTASGVSKGGPLMVTFTTMHGFFDRQAARRDAEGW